ncbi:TRAUB domain-containing protein/AATF-Che1 domain-containing protein [Cephalotus follicularis]|uniref:TRAUB domain-containing protein/AATF-Che1 domain-containing protein n=1 Tax=Cephalotus follicularis TaxID=3775 RepID=A0A1Q3BZN7_CEPFO|nr:TRAUB domain-containing protein/AATF-Che1 domain-containing protein [Cephalotus follicularis]
MGKSAKRQRTGRDGEIDMEDLSDLEMENLMVEKEDDEEEEENDFEDEDVEVDDDAEEGENEGPEVEGEEEEVLDEEEDGQEEDGDEQNKIRRDAEMEELEKEYMDLRHQEQDILKNLKSHKNEDLLKGQAVKNQKALWDKTLEFRFLLQKVFSSSNRLPLDPVRSSFCTLDGVSEAYSELITTSKETLDSLLELQEVLVEKNPSIAQSKDGNSGKLSKKSLEDFKNLDVQGDEEWLRISQMHKRVAPFRDKSVDKWQRKTQVTTGAAAIKGKLQAFNQNISEQVAAYMRDPSRMIKQMQQRRSTVGVFGAVPKGEDNARTQEAQPDGDPELLDDSEFYEQLLKEFFEMVDPTSTETAFYALRKLQTKKRKVVDRRASKSRKIRYNVHEKIVNFMAPQPMDLPPMAPKLFENLFGLKTQKPAFVV